MVSEVRGDAATVIHAVVVDVHPSCVIEHRARHIAATNHSELVVISEL